YQAGPGTAPALCGPTFSCMVARSIQAMLPPPAPIEATSVTGRTVWYLPKTGRPLTSGSPSTTRPTSKLVPPTSVVITLGKPSTCPSAAAPTTPPAGPDATSLIACPFAFAVDVTPPEDCMTSGGRRSP